VISGDTDLDAGQSTILSCVGYGEPGLVIRWYFAGAPVLSTTVSIIREMDLVKGGVIYRQSFLQLCSPTVLANGDYTCVVDNTQISVNASTQLTVTG
jgi:hypothetical protein